MRVLRGVRGQRGGMSFPASRAALRVVLLCTSAAFPLHSSSCTTSVDAAGSGKRPSADEFARLVLVFSCFRLCISEHAALSSCETRSVTGHASSKSRFGNRWAAQGRDGHLRFTAVGRERAFGTDQTHERARESTGTVMKETHPPTTQNCL